jgi:hypothetical protein
MQPDREFAAVGPTRETASGSHSIHLGNAWEAEPGKAGHGPAWVRRFGRPTGLGAADAVWLVIDAPADAALTLNGVALPASAAGATYRANVTPLLCDRNLLVLVPRLADEPVSLPAARGPLPAALGRVRLEIVPGGGEQRS